ncbi:MAG: hypothetical protein KGI25_10165, partial [Thaumarchaeota archaeon]|nr:hypothetical protein [Nitrososphaerota archaeon]
MKASLLLMPVIAFLAMMITTTASADNASTPQWIENDVKWWSEGAISSADFTAGMQYLEQQGIVPVQYLSQATSTTSTPDDNDRAMSVVVRFVNIQNAPSGIGSE